MKKTTHNRQRGMTLVELMVSLVIGLFLMIGAFTVYLHTRASFHVTQTVARLQENGRFALDAIAPDIRMAHFWGLTSRTNRIDGQATPSETQTTLASGSCGTNWIVNLAQDIGGSNDSYGFGCDAYGSGAETKTDTLVIRRAASEPVTALTANTLYVQSGRFQNGQLFKGVTVPSGHPGAELYPLVVDGYYVSKSSTLGTDIPSLRVKALNASGGITDQEVIPGVEDMQVQFGIDDNANGSIDRYVNPGDALLDDAGVQILAVRIWLRIRALKPQQDFTDDKSYTYAGHTVAAPNDHYRRIVVSKTIYIRNARSVT